MKTRLYILVAGMLLATALSTLLCRRASAAQFEDVTISDAVTNASGYCNGAAWGD